MFKLFGNKEIKAPVEEGMRGWIEYAMQWLFLNFDEDTCKENKVYFSLKELLNDFELQTASLNDLTKIVAELMVIDINEVAVDVYDEGERLYSKLTNSSSVERRRAWDACVWVGIPMTATGKEFLSTDAILKIRVKNPYRRYATKGNVVKLPLSTTSNNETTSENEWYNLYKFDTRSVATGKIVKDTAVSVLDLINVVPNPYYAYSNYETSRLDSRIKITNLQERCVVRIYNVGGSLVRTLTKADPSTSLDWDLKNVNGVPIAGGVYIIHVDVPDAGEKIIKWFGSLRPPDLTSF